MFFSDEPEHVRQARQAPLYSTWESRQRDSHRIPAPPPNDAQLKRAIT